jgi:hypothetical protein
VAEFWPTKVGEGSDRVPGRDIEMFVAQAQLFAAGKVNIKPEMTSVNLPVSIIHLKEYLGRILLTQQPKEVTLNLNQTLTFLKLMCRKMVK